MANFRITWPTPVPEGVTDRTYTLRDNTRGVEHQSGSIGLIATVLDVTLIFGNSYTLDLYYKIGSETGIPRSQTFIATDTFAPPQPGTMSFTFLGYNASGKAMYNVGLPTPVDPVDVVAYSYTLFHDGNVYDYGVDGNAPIPASISIPALTPNVEYTHGLVHRDGSNLTSTQRIQTLTHLLTGEPPAPSPVIIAHDGYELDAAGTQHLKLDVTVPIVPVNAPPRNVHHQVVKICAVGGSPVFQTFTPAVDTENGVVIQDVKVTPGVTIEFHHTYHSSSGESVANSSPVTVTEYTPVDTTAPTQPGALTFNVLGQTSSTSVLIDVVTSAVVAVDVVTRRRLRVYLPSNFSQPPVQDTDNISPQFNSWISTLTHPNTYGFKWNDYDQFGNVSERTGTYTTTVAGIPPQPGAIEVEPIPPG